MYFFRKSADQVDVEAEMDDNCIQELCNPEGLPVTQAIRLARRVSRIEPNLAPSLGAYVCHLADSPTADERSLHRALELLSAISDPRTFAAAARRRNQSETRP